MIKVCLIGASGTGKSTIAQKIAEEFDDVTISPSFGRQVKEWGINISEMGGCETNLATLSLLVSDFHKQDTNCAIKVYPRSFLDGIVFSEMISEESTSGFESVGTKDALLSIWKAAYGKYKDQYDVFFYLPIEFKIEDDGVRPTDEKFNELYDKSLNFWMERFNIKPITLRGGVEERMKVVKEELCKLL